MTTKPEITKEQIDAMAEACVENPLNYREFVAGLASDPATYNVSREVVHGLVAALHRLTPASLELDHFKRAMTYGEKLRINPPANDPNGISNLVATSHSRMAIPMKLTPEQESHLLLIHGVLGKITEALEMAPILVALLQKDSFDAVNLVEELGDDEWYSALVAKALNLPVGEAVRRNVRKLAKRYKGGVFTRGEAVNRNLDVERAALGTDDTPGEGQ
jgi:hypothetical protein